MVYQEIGTVPFWIMDDEELHLSNFSLWFCRVSSAIIDYCYRFSYLYMHLYQFYPFSRVYIIESTLFRMYKGVHLRDEYKYGRRSGVGANVKNGRAGLE